MHFSKGDKVLGVSELIFSDDRRLVHFRKEYFEYLTWDRIETTKSAGGRVNPGKLEMFHAVLRQGVLQLDEEEACVGLIMRAGKQPPTCIGVPVFQEMKPLLWLSATAALWRKLTPSIVRADFLPIKTVRVIMAFMVARFDYAASAYLFREEWPREMQQIIDRAFCEAHGLSIRVAKLFLYLPPQWAGTGCPWLPLRAEMRYLRQVMKMPHSRSGLAQMVADELLDEEPRIRSSNHVPYDGSLVPVNAPAEESAATSLTPGK